MDDAIAVLTAALDRRSEGPQPGPDVRLALRALQFLGVPRADCRYFWEGCAADNEIGRVQSMNAALNRIRLSLDGKGSSKSSAR